MPTNCVHCQSEQYSWLLDSSLNEATLKEFEDATKAFEIARVNLQVASYAYDISRQRAEAHKPHN